MVSDRFERNKYDLFPEIEDWTLSYDNHRHRKDWWNMSMRYYLIFSKISFRLGFYGLKAGNPLAFAFLTVFFFVRFNNYWWVLWSLLCVHQTFKLIESMKEWSWRKNMTFYDLWFREGKIVGDKA